MGINFEGVTDLVLSIKSRDGYVTYVPCLDFTKANVAADIATIPTAVHIAIFIQSGTGAADTAAFLADSLALIRPVSHASKTAFSNIASKRNRRKTSTCIYRCTSSSHYFMYAVITDNKVK